MKIKVEKEHIENAVRKDSHHCMIADAIKDRLPNVQYILVDLQSIRFSDPELGERYTYFTPPLAQQKLLEFDKGRKGIKPFEFNLNAPKIAKMNTGQRVGSKKNNKKRKPGSKRKYTVRKEREFGIRIYTETR